MSRILKAIVPSRKHSSFASNVLILLLMMAGFVGVTFDHFLEYQQESEAYAEELNRLNAAREILQQWEDKKRLLHTSDYEKEKKARQLQMVRENETVIYLEMDDGATTVSE